MNNTPRNPRRLVAIHALLALIAASCAILVACNGSGKANITAPTPLGPVLVDVWWCDQEQCFAATPPADTPPGAQLVLEGVPLDMRPAR